jgi:hypothetical protein
MPYWPVIRSAPNHDRLAAESVVLAGRSVMVQGFDVSNDYCEPGRSTVGAVDAA